MKMLENLKSIVAVLVFGFSVGVSLIAYAHANFATKEIIVMISDRLERIENKLDQAMLRTP